MAGLVPVMTFISYARVCLPLYEPLHLILQVTVGPFKAIWQASADAHADDLIEFVKSNSIQLDNWSRRRIG